MVEFWWNFLEVKMGFKWHQTKFKGLRFREHPTRKKGSVKKDVCYQVRFILDGKRVEETLGWATEGWTLEKAALKLGELREAQRTGEGERTLSEKRQKAEAERMAEEARRAQEQRDNMTFATVFHEHYMPVQRQNKSKVSCDKEEGFFRNWMTDVIDTMPMKEVSGFSLEKLKKKMADAGRSPKTINYCLGTVRQVFNFAARHGLYTGRNPVSLVKKPKVDNRRMRFLSKAEADELFEALAERSQDLHDMALLSLHCGLRAGEIFALRWGDVDMERNMLMLVDTKNGETRAAYLTDGARLMFEGRERGGKDELVFPDQRHGGMRKEISNVFQEVADELFNEDVEDRRFRVVFHTLRHSFASLLVENGVPIFSVKELLGHKSLAMTTRYSHMAPDTLRKSVDVLDQALQQKKVKSDKVINLRDRG